MRRQEATQRIEARRQHINRECVRLAELQYTVGILCQQEQRQDPSLDQRQQHLNNPPPPPPPNYNIPPPPPTKLPHPLSPTIITYAQPIHPTSAAIRHHKPQKSTSQPPAGRTMAPALPSHSLTQISWKCRPSQISRPTKLP
jgi:hypothetical protein